MSETTVRPELSALPPRLKRLPIDKRGYPVPWFVAWVNGEPEFRAMDAAKWRRAVRDRLCWVCGDRLGVHLTFVIGPMCALNRTIAEPPSHHDCAEWSARNCPFLSRPKMVRREDDEINADTHKNSPGLPLLRNPGVACLWTTRRYTVFRDSQRGGHLIQIGEPERVEWFAHGRPATRDEVRASIESGLPALQEACDMEATDASRLAARAELARRRQEVGTLLPTEAIT